MSSSPLSPYRYRPTRLRAICEDWIVNEDAGGPMLKRTIPSKFTIEIRMTEYGRRTVFQAMMAGTLQKIGKPFCFCRSNIILIYYFQHGHAHGAAEKGK